MFDQAKSWVRSLTEIGVALLSLAIVASLLVGPTNMTFLGNVVDNITNLVKSLGSAGLAGLISLGVVLWLVQNK
jgi:choline-glycine betaine transporter